jgi:hypothetical protein
MDHTLSESIDQAKTILKGLNYEKGHLRAAMEYAQLQFVLNFTEVALATMSEIEPALLKRRMINEYLEAGLLIAKVHQKMLDFGLAEG